MSTAKGKKPTTARWGWHGAGIISLPRTAIPGGHDTSARAAPDLRAIAAGLARTPDDGQRIEAELVSLRSVYHRYLRQDEFGPGRVEQLIALRELARFADRAIDLITTVPFQLREPLSVELNRIERFSRRTWFDVTEIRAFALAADRLRRKSERYQLNQSRIDLLRNLASTLTELINRISLLDTNTQATTWLFAVVNKKRLEPDMPVSATAEQTLSRLQLQLEATIDTLASMRGPDPQKSLSWLVTCLCDLWRRETGHGVESMGWMSVDSGGQPQSGAAKFVTSVVEAFQSKQGWLETQLPAYTSTQLTFTGPEHHRARRVKYLIRDYVRCQPQEVVPKRRPRLQSGIS